MKKFLTTLTTNILLISLGLGILICPLLLEYLNDSKFYFDMVGFLKDYPCFRFPIGIIVLLIGVIGLVFSVFQFKQDNTAYVIQKGRSSDYGAVSLSYPKTRIGNSSPLVYTNLSSISGSSKNILKLEKENIDSFYSSIGQNKKISFLSISLFPFIIYAGYCVGESGRKIEYYHYNRSKKKTMIVPNGLTSTNCVLKKNGIDGNKTRTLCFSISYKIDEEIVKKEFGGTSICFYECKNIGTESMKNIKDIEEVSNTIRKMISESTDPTNLLLHCPAELGFAIGQKLKSPGLPAIKIYNYCAKDTKKKWNWHITLD